MRQLSIVLLIIITGLLSHCSKSASGPSSAEGKWTYTTPDSKVTVTFDLVKTSAGSLDIQNQTIKIDGTVYNAEKQISGVNLPIIGLIRINANDAKAVYPYYIQFTNGSVSGDFRLINVPDTEYTFPWGTTKTLKTISIGRP